MFTESQIIARYAETDQMGVVHHAVYPVWYEVARTDFIKALGISYSALEKLGVMTPLTDLGCRYRGVTRYEDVLVVRTWLTRLTPARMEFFYEVLRQGETQPCNTGFTAHGFVDSVTFRPLNLKKRFAALYDSLEQALEPEKAFHK